MLEPHIIDAIRKEEEARQLRFEQARLRLYIPTWLPEEEDSRDDAQEDEDEPIVISMI